MSTTQRNEDPLPKVRYPWLFWSVLLAATFWAAWSMSGCARETPEDRMPETYRVQTLPQGAGHIMEGDDYTVETISVGGTPLLRFQLPSEDATFIEEMPVAVPDVGPPRIGSHGMPMEPTSLTKVDRCTDLPAADSDFTFRVELEDDRTLGVAVGPHGAIPVHFIGQNSTGGVDIVLSMNDTHFYVAEQDGEEWDYIGNAMIPQVQMGFCDYHAELHWINGPGVKVPLKGDIWQTVEAAE